MAKQPPKVTEKNYAAASIEDYAADIIDIWPLDEKRPVLYQWLSVVEHASCVAEEVRKTAWNRVAREVAEVFVWWLSFVKCLALPRDKDRPDLLFYMPASAAEIVWWKFPNVCPVCFGSKLSEEAHIDPCAEYLGGKDIDDATLRNVYNEIRGKPCQCLSRKSFVETRSSAFKQFTKQYLAAVAGMNLAEIPNSLTGFEQVVTGLFKNNVSALKIEEVAFHFLEEVGEVSEALVKLHQQPERPRKEFKAERTAKLMNLGEELADVFSW